MPKEGKWRNHTTRFGAYVASMMDDMGVSVSGVCDLLGIRYETFTHIMTSPHTSFYLPWIFKLSDLLGTSADKLLFLLYDDQAISSNLTEEEKRMQVKLLLTFDLFYRLDESDQEIFMFTLSSFVKRRGEKVLSEGQQEFLNKLRVHPPHGSGAGKHMPERIQKELDAGDATPSPSASPRKSSSPAVRPENIKSDTCPKCGGTTWKPDGWPLRGGIRVRRYKCADCGKQVVDPPAVAV